MFSIVQGKVGVHRKAGAGFLSVIPYTSEAMHDLLTRKPKKAKSRMVLRWPVEETFEMVARFRPAIRLNEQQFADLCAINPELRIEQTSKGELIFMPPVSSEGSNQNFKLYLPFAAWADHVSGGEFFDSSGGFQLPNGAVRSPDLSWVARTRLDGLQKEDWHKFMKLCPDFVLELRSRSDRLPKLQAKMAEYVACGARLGWLIDPLEKQVFVYRPGEQVEHLLDPATLSGEPVLAGFTLDLARVW